MLCCTAPSDARVSDIRVRIKIDQHQQFKVYSPNVPIIGNLVVTSNRDTAFDKVEISLVGTAVTHNYVQPEPVHTTLPFIKLDMRCNGSTFADGRLFKAGKTYLIPFNFVIPHHMPMGSCKHQSISASLQERHLRLPPSIGLCPSDDQSPEAAQINYNIVAIALKRAASSADPIVLFATKESIRVLPPCAEEPPLGCFGGMYKLSNTKRIWKNIFRDTGGELTATVWQPSAVMLSPDGSSASSSSIHLQLAFVPSSMELPPIRITSVSGRLLCKTFFDIMPIGHAPALEQSKRGGYEPYYDTRRHTLFNRQVGELQWTVNGCKHELPRRQDSSVRRQSHTEAQAGKHQEIRTRRASLPWAWKPPEESSLRYTAELDSIFSIPHGKRDFFLPTFDSCSISRAYSLKVTLRVGPMQRSLTLSVPIQIGVEEDPVQHIWNDSRSRRMTDDCFIQLGRDDYEEPPSYTARL